MAESQVAVRTVPIFPEPKCRRCRRREKTPPAPSRPRSFESVCWWQDRIRSCGQERALPGPCHPRRRPNASPPFSTCWTRIIDLHRPRLRSARRTCVWIPALMSCKARQDETFDPAAQDRKLCRSWSSRRRMISGQDGQPLGPDLVFLDKDKQFKGRGFRTAWQQGSAAVPDRLKFLRGQVARLFRPS